MRAPKIIDTQNQNAGVRQIEMDEEERTTEREGEREREGALAAPFSAPQVIGDASVKSQIAKKVRVVMRGSFRC